MLPTFVEYMLIIDTAVVQRCANLHFPNRCSDRDAFRKSVEGAQTRQTYWVERVIKSYSRFGNYLIYSL